MLALLSFFSLLTPQSLFRDYFLMPFFFYLKWRFSKAEIKSNPTAHWLSRDVYLIFVPVKSSSDSSTFHLQRYWTYIYFFFCHGLAGLLHLLILLLNNTDTDLKHPKKACFYFLSPLAHLVGRKNMHRFRQSWCTACSAEGCAQKEYMKANSRLRDFYFNLVTFSCEKENNLSFKRQTNSSSGTRVSFLPIGNGVSSHLPYVNSGTFIEQINYIDNLVHCFHIGKNAVFTELNATLSMDKWNGSIS